MRKAVPLPRVARDAGANDVLPSSRAAAISRNHVIEIQILALENVPAVLASIAVALKDIVPCKFHFLLRQPVKHHEQNDPRHPDFE